MTIHYPNAVIKTALDRKYPGHSLADQMTREYYKRDAIVRTPFMVGEWTAPNGGDWDAHGDLSVGEHIQILAFTNAGFRGIEATLAATSPRTSELIIKHNVGIANLALPPVLPGGPRPYVNYVHDNSIRSQRTRTIRPRAERAPIGSGPRGTTHLIFMPPRSCEE